MNKSCLFFHIFSTLLVLSLVSSCSLVNRNSQKLKKGILYLEKWNPEHDMPVKLSGEWGFVWNQFLDPSLNTHAIRTIIQNNPHLSSYVKVPSHWTSYRINGIYPKGEGYSTFYLEVYLDKEYDNLALSFYKIHTSFQCYVNGQLVASAGKAEKTLLSTIPQYLPQIVKINKANKLNIIIHVSNFDHIYGGISYSILLGDENRLIKTRESKINLDLIIFGFIIIMGIVHGIQYMFQKKDISLLMFFLFCCSISLRAITTDELYYFQPLFNINWSILKKIEALSFFIAGPIVLSYIYSIFQPQKHKKVIKYILLTTLIVNIIVIFTPLRVYGHLIKPYQVLTILLLFYCLYIVCNALLKKQRYTLIFLIGLLLFTLTAINDILYNIKVVDTAFISHIGFMSVIICQTIYISKRNAYISELINTFITTGNVYISNQIFRNKLTPREKEILSYIILGKDSKNIASNLNISVKTVENHTYNLFQKLGIHSRYEIFSRFQNKVAENVQRSMHFLIKNG